MGGSLGGFGDERTSPNEFQGQSPGGGVRTKPQKAIKESRNSFHQY